MQNFIPVPPLTKCLAVVSLIFCIEFRTLYCPGFFGELLDWKSGKTLGIKEHVLYLRSYAEISGMFEKFIFLIRNPFDSLLAEYNRMVSGHVGHREGTDFKASGK